MIAIMVANLPVGDRGNGGHGVRKIGMRMLGVTAALVVTIGAVSAGTVAGAEPLPGQVGESAAAGAAGTSSQVPFQVTYDGKSFAASLPPSSIATYTWTPGNSTVGVTETETSDGSLVKNVELARQPSLSFGTTSRSLPAVTVKPSIAMQKIAGFGGAMSQSSASLINNSPSEKTIMDALFGPAGAHFGIVRVPMGASDFVTGPIYQDGTSFSYDDNGGRADPALTRFSIGTRSATGAKAKACAPASSRGEYGTGDYADIIPALLCAKSLNASLNLLAVPWSAPGWMKIDDPTVPAHCKGSDDFLKNSDYAIYARYFLKFLQGYQSARLRVSEMSMQNEPENCSTTYPTMEMTPSDQATFAKDLHSELRSAQSDLTVTPAIMAYDHDYLDNPNPPWDAPANQVTGYPEAVISQSGGTRTSLGPVGLAGFHHYNGNLAQEEQALDREHDAYPNVPIWMTEATGTYGTSTQAQNFAWEGQHDLMEPLQNWTSASLYLNLVLNPSGGPHDGGCGDGSDPCRGMVTLNANGAYSLNEDYYDWAQFSKFIQPGATHICSDIIDLSASAVHACTSAGSSWIPTGGDNLIDTVAFRNPNGSIVLVAMNTTPDLPSPAGTWTAAKAPLPSGAATDPQGTVLGLSCPSATMCIAAGDYDDTSRHTLGMLLAWASGKWTASRAPLPANAAASRVGEVSAVSCPSTTRCTAAGLYSDSSGSFDGMLLTWASGKWTASRAPLPANAAASPAEWVSAVSCPSTTRCTAAGSYNDTSGFPQGLLLTWSGAKWAASEIPLPANAASGSDAQLWGVTCPSIAWCTATGFYVSTSGYPQGLLLTWSGGKWAASQAPLPTGATNGPDTDVYAVSCPSTTRCTAVGAYTGPSGDERPLLLTWSARKWTAAEAPLPANAVSSPGAGISTVSCPSTTQCIAAGGYTTAGGPAGLLLTFSAGKWIASQAPLPAGGFDSGVIAVSCASRTQCTAGGNYLDASGNWQALLLTGPG